MKFDSTTDARKITPMKKTFRIVEDGKRKKKDIEVLTIGEVYASTDDND